MEDLFQFVFGLLEFAGSLLELSGEKGIAAMFDGGLMPWDWLGFVGASVWLILSLGRVQWENKDWRAVCSGLVMLIGSVSLLVWGGLSHYAASCAAV